MYKIERLREFNQELIEKLYNIENEAFGDGALNRWSFPMFIRHGAIYVLKYNTKIVGVADIIRDWEDSKLAFIYNFVIKKEHRSKGLSGIFLSGLIKELIREGILRAQLTVDPQNAPALKAYKKAGFKDISYLKDEYGKKVDRILMELDVREGNGRGR